MYKFYNNQWSGDVGSIFKLPILRTYRSFKLKFSFEPYLDCIKIDRHRKAFSRFRCGSHHLTIETGRWSGTPIGDRLCPACGVLDDEWHLFCSCKINATDRLSFYSKLNQFLGVDAFNEFAKSIFKNSLSSTSAPILCITASFIHNSFKRRERFFDAQSQRD